MRSLRLVPYWSVHETLGVDAHNAPLKMRTRRIHLSRAVAWSCGRRHPVAGAVLGSTDVEGSDPYGKGVSAMLKPVTLVLVGLASAAAIAHAFRAPFPGPGGNPVLDLVAYHDPGFHTVIRVWYYVAPAVAVVLFGSLGLSVWRVWLQPRAGGGRRGTLPPWPASPEDETPSLVIGELHHPVVPRESERPSWLVIPETGLYTGVLIVGAVGSGKTSACMYPFAQQLLSWQADRPGRRASALVLEVKGDFCHDVRGDPREGRARGRLPGDRAGRVLAVEPTRRSAARHLLARLQRRLPDQPALRQESRAVLAASLHESRALDQRTTGGANHGRVRRWRGALRGTVCISSALLSRRCQVRLP